MLLLPTLLTHLMRKQNLVIQNFGCVAFPVCYKDNIIFACYLSLFKNENEVFLVFHKNIYCLFYFSCTD